jgi:hypothetical protein
MRERSLVRVALGKLSFRDFLTFSLAKEPERRMQHYIIKERKEKGKVEGRENINP